MTPQDRDLTINMSGISVSGVGGLGLVAVAGLIIYTFQQAWWLFVCATLPLAAMRNHISRSSVWVSSGL